MRTTISMTNGKEVFTIENTGANLIAEVLPHNDGFRIRLVDTANWQMLDAPSNFTHREDALECARVLVSNDIGARMTLAIAGEAYHG
jgi:hypothetical protein